MSRADTHLSVLDRVLSRKWLVLSFIVLSVISRLSFVWFKHQEVYQASKEISIKVPVELDPALVNQAINLTMAKSTNDKRSVTQVSSDTTVHTQSYRFRMIVNGNDIKSIRQELKELEADVVASLRESLRSVVLADIGQASNSLVRLRDMIAQLRLQDAEIFGKTISVLNSYNATAPPGKDVLAGLDVSVESDRVLLEKLNPLQSPPGLWFQIYFLVISAFFGGLAGLFFVLLVYEIERVERA